MAFCSACGASLPENATFCQNCGKQVIQAQTTTVHSPVYSQQVMYVKAKIPGRGFGIASMVLSIIGLVYAVPMFSAVMELINSLYIDGAVLAPIIIFSSLSIMPIPFYIAAKGRGYYNGISKSGLVMGVIGTSLYVIALILAIINL